MRTSRSWVTPETLTASRQPPKKFSQRIKKNFNEITRVIAYFLLSILMTFPNYS